MRYWFGAVLFAGAALLLWSALRHRARVFAIASREAIEAHREAASADPRSLAALGEIGRPIVRRHAVITGRARPARRRISAATPDSRTAARPPA